MQEKLEKRNFTICEEPSLPFRVTESDTDRQLKLRSAQPDLKLDEPNCLFGQLVSWMQPDLDFHAGGSLQKVLSYRLNEVFSEGMEVERAKIHFPLRTDRVFILAPVDWPEGEDALNKVLDETHEISKRMPDSEASGEYAEHTFQQALDKKPDILIICCHREKKRILLGSDEEKHLKNADFVSIFSQRRQEGRHIPRLIILSTCGGATREDGAELPKLLVGVGVDLVVHWVGPAPDHVAALYSKHFVDHLVVERLTEAPKDRFVRSHVKALAALPREVSSLVRAAAATASWELMK